MSPLVQRWVTGVLVALPVLAFIAFGPPWSWWFLVTLFATFGLREMHGLLFPEGVPAKYKYLSTLVGLLLPLAASLAGGTGLNVALALALFSALFLMLATSPLRSEDIACISLLCLGWLYVPYLLSFALLIGTAPAGRIWIVFVLVVIIAGDSGAYHTGLHCGRRKLYELVSPKKTIEGAIGGFASSVIAGTLFGLILLPTSTFASLIVFSSIVAVTGQIGDLFESMIKRNCGKKDSGSLLPGHGGVLDRLDSMLFAFPVLWALLNAVGLDR
ncbi:MAG: phosphatidate cytidylyltransferase [Desulfobacteraceae bacterium]|nr:phosphatidate cytidylyltransferase [Desulfobacteraceae bacterium]